MQAAQPFDCPGNYISPDPNTLLKCSKCERKLAAKDAQRTPTGYVCPYFVKARVATFYSANAGHYAVAGIISLVCGALLGVLLNLVSRIGLFSIMIMLIAAPAAGGAIAELVRLALRKMGNARGQYIWLVGAVCIALGAAYFNILPALAQFSRGSPSAIFALIPLVGLGLAISTFVARSRL
jgi:hypothetical protein